MTEPAGKPRSLSLAVVENVTLWSVVATVSLFTVGQLAHFYEWASYGLHGLRVDVPWQDRVFEAGRRAPRGPGRGSPCPSSPARLFSPSCS